MLRGKNLFGCMVVLVVVALILSGCGKSSGGSSGNGGNGGKGGSGGSVVTDYSAFKGVWKSQNLTPAVEIMVGEQIEGDEEWFYFTGKVTCDVFQKGYLEITETDNFILGEKCILARIFNFGGNSFLVRAYEEDEDEYGETITNEIKLDGYLSDANTLKAARLYVREKDKDKIDFDPEDGTQFITFKKQ